MKYQIKVTLGHIAKGCQKTTDNCPVFHAMQDAGIPVRYVCGTIWWNLDMWPFSIPETALKNIRHYDKTGEMFPFTFTIEI